MEITPSLIYWIATVDEIRGSLKGVVIGIGAVSLVAIVVFVLGCCACFSEINNCAEAKRLFQGSKKALKICLIVFCFAVIGRIGVGFIPTKETFATMIVVPTVVNNKDVQGITKEALQWATEYLKELKSGKEKK